jgi:hypothetical protein
VLDRTSETGDSVSEATAQAAAQAAPARRGWLRAVGRFMAARMRDGAARFRASLVDIGTGTVNAWHILRTEGILGAIRHLWQFIVAFSFSSLSRRIVFINVVGLAAFVIGVLFLSQFRAGLIDARVQSLEVQGEIIAGAIAASATAEQDAITIDPDRLLELRAGESYGPSDDALFGLDFPINPERVAPLLRRLISPTNTRAHLRPRRRTAARQPQPLFARRSAAL